MVRDPVASQYQRLHVTWKAACCLLIVLSVLAEAAPAFSRSNEIALSQPLTIKWRYQSDRMSNLTPATDGKSVYLPQAGGILLALDGSDGRLRWKADAGGELSSAPITDDRCVYAATQYRDSADKQHPIHGTLRALSKETGVTLWMRTLPGPLLGSLVAGQNALFAGAGDGRVYAFDKRTGLALWINQYAETFSGQPAVSGNFLYIGSDEGNLFVLDQATGEHAWHFRARGPIQGAIAVANGIVYFGSADGYVYAVREIRSKLLWRRRTGAAVQAVVPVSNGLLAASFDNFAYFLSLNKGSLVWRRLLPGRVAARPITAADGALFTPLSTDNAIVLSLKDGKPVNTLLLGEESSSGAAPIAVGDLVVISTAHGLLAFAAPRQKP